MPDTIVLHGRHKELLHEVLEGYLYGLGEICFELFGPNGERAMYAAIGRLYLRHLREKLNATVDDPDPWRRYAQVIDFFTSYGFYEKVEMKPVGDGTYWMSECGQYAGAIWEEVGSWQRGTAPCPLFSVVVAALAEIGSAIVIDRVEYQPASAGFESVFHFVAIQPPADALEHARTEVRAALIPICMFCHKVREGDGWVPLDVFAQRMLPADLSQCVCEPCLKGRYGLTL